MVVMTTQRSSQTTVADPFMTAEVMQGSHAPTPYRLATPQTDLPGQMDNTPPLTKGAKIRAMIKCINDMRHVGVESTVRLPRICVIGDQSAGKSSLVEALSDIKIPRADGACTRCPLEINMTETNLDDEWRCKVFLTLTYDHDKKYTKASQNITQQRPLGPWIKKLSIEREFGETNNKDEVLDLVQRAQLAVLNPHQNPSSFMAKDIPAQSSPEKFSPNTVRLDIQGPGYCNLSFVDLPGIIKNTENREESFLVELVQNLTKEYVNMKNCILILTLPMTNDIENCNAFDTLRKVKHADERTLAVITKSDRAGSQTILKTWQDRVLGQESYRLGLGYHAVMMEGETNLARDVMLEKERVFFDGPDWSRLVPQFSARLGIPALSITLEDLLATQISKSLPKITRQISDRAALISRQLEKLPPRTFTDCPEFTLGQLTRELDTSLKALFKGRGNESTASGLKTKWSDLCQAFRNCLLDTRPILDPSTSVEKKLMTKLRAAATAVPPEKTVRPGKTMATVDLVTNSEEDEDAPFTKFSSSHKVFTFADITGYNSRSNHTNLLNSKSSGAVEEMNRASVVHWPSPVKVFMDLTKELVYEEVSKVASVVFAEYHQTDLYQEVLKTLTNLLEEKGEEQYLDAIRAYRMEQEHPLTFDLSGLKRETKLSQKRLSKLRNDYRLELAQARVDVEGPTKGKSRIIKEEELEADEFDTQIDITAVRDPLIRTKSHTFLTSPQEVQGYYKLAASRFVDGVCLLVQARLFATCGRELECQIRSDLGLANDMGVTSM